MDGEVKLTPRMNIGSGKQRSVPDADLHTLSKYAAEMSPARSNSQQALDAILGAILNGSLVAGQRLAEVPVSRAIGIGRTPVREALMRLEAEGFVVAEPRVGMVVAGSTLSAFAELYEIRELLEGFASKLAARYARDADILAIRCAVEDSAVPTQQDDVMRLRQLNTQFHEAIHTAARNDQLREILRNIINRLRLSMISVYSVPGRAEDALIEHRAILEAIILRDEGRAALLASEHQLHDKEVRLEQMSRSSFSEREGRRA